jgi:uncharacterized protein Yka (UPF0111/DUF47 family)
MAEEAKVFVRIDDYKEVLNTIHLIKNRLEDAKKVLSEISDLKKQEDSQLGSWNSTLNMLENKIDSFDRTLVKPEFEPEH